MIIRYPCVKSYSKKDSFEEFNIEYNFHETGFYLNFNFFYSEIPNFLEEFYVLKYTPENLSLTPRHPI
jgi:hypothetical protein